MEKNKLLLGAMIEYQKEDYLIIGYENEREELKGYKCIKRFERVKEDEIFTLSNEQINAVMNNKNDIIKG